MYFAALPLERAAKCLAAAMAATEAGAVALARMADDEPVILGDMVKSQTRCSSHKIVI
jgi:hypothetical protein